MTKGPGEEVGDLPLNLMGFLLLPFLLSVFGYFHQKPLFFRVFKDLERIRP